MQTATINFDSVITRFGGEIWIKSNWTRRAYEKQLLQNIKNTLKHHSTQFRTIERKHGRFYVRTENAKDVAAIMTRVFGLSSVSPAKKTTAKIDDIVATSLALANQTLKEGDSFAVRCKREGEHSFKSTDINQIVGQQILEKFGKRNIKVNLNNPTVTLGIEVRDEDAFVFSEQMDAVGGMPFGTQPRAVCLQSGGIDSPVACWLTMKRGCPMVQIYFDNAPFTDQATTERAIDIAKVLFDWAIGFQRKIYIVPHGRNLKEITEKCPRRFTCLLCKRMMYRVAEKIADIENAEGIVTGEAIGEQASQTLRNLRVLNTAVIKYPVHRPLLGFDKTETEKLAKKIETYNTSIRKAKSCTAAPEKPSTHAKIEDVENAEKALDIENLVENSLKTAKQLLL
jgi:thiamine biosynthesis protein ThiI